MHSSSRTCRGTWHGGGDPGNLLTTLAEVDDMYTVENIIHEGCSRTK